MPEQVIGSEPDRQTLLTDALHAAGVPNVEAPARGHTVRLS